MVPQRIKLTVVKFPYVVMFLIDNLILKKSGYWQDGNEFWCLKLLKNIVATLSAAIKTDRLKSGHWGLSRLFSAEPIRSQSYSYQDRLFN